VADLTPTYTNLSRALLDEWARVGRTDARLLGKGWLFVQIAGLVVAAMGIYYSEGRSTTLPVTALWFFLGFITHGTLVQWKSLRIRQRVLRDMWDRMVVEGPVKLYESPDGIIMRSSTGEETKLPWIEMRRVNLLSGHPRLWAAGMANGSIAFVSEAAFRDAGAFEAWADRAYDAWQSCRPTGKGFEVANVH
jgi:hypothetical protein